MKTKVNYDILGEFLDYNEEDLEYEKVINE